MFYCDIDNFDLKKMDRNYYDLSQNYMFLSLLPIDLKRKFLEYVNEETYETYKYILNIKENTSHNIDEAKFYIFGPFSYHAQIEDEISQYSNHLKNKNFKKIFFCSSDDDRNLDLSEVFEINWDEFLFFKTGGERSKNKKNVLGMPFIVNDYFRGNYKEKDLSLSYCGYPDNNSFKRNIINQLSFLDYSDFIIRDSWADNGENKNSFLVGPNKKSKMEFIDNIERNLYGLAVRGFINSSYRLYELFMMGRIPVLLNTDCLLPFENEIPYETNTILITEFDNIDKKIQKFHERHTEEELLNIQKQNRKIWLKYFRVDGAFKQTKKIILEKYFDKRSRHVIECNDADVIQW